MISKSSRLPSQKILFFLLFPRRRCLSLEILKKISLFTRFIHLIIVMEIRPEFLYLADTVIGSLFLCCDSFLLLFSRTLAHLLSRKFFVLNVFHFGLFKNRDDEYAGSLFEYFNKN